MKTPVIAGAIILGLGAVTFALARQDGRPAAPAGAPAPQSSDKPPGDRAELHARVAKLRAEIEVLQLEHDLAREQLAAGLTAGPLPPPTTGLMGRSDSAGASTPQQIARDYMRIGAELVGKGPEFEAAMQEKGDEIWQAVNKAVPATTPADIGRIKQDFLRIATELNRKKIELVELEIHLEGSM